MTDILPEAIRRYLDSLNRLGDPLLSEVYADSKALGIPAVLPETGALLHLLASAMGARRALEIGTALGYSGLWIVRGMPEDGLFITIERDPERAVRARANFEKSGVGRRATVMIGDASRMVAKVSGPFDFIFQDGDKPLYAALLDRLVSLLRPGGVMVTDNILWSGEVVPGFVPSPEHEPESTAAIVQFSRQLSNDTRLRTIFLPVGDGVAVSVRSQESAVDPNS